MYAHHTHQQSNWRHLDRFVEKGRTDVQQDTLALKENLGERYGQPERSGIANKRSSVMPRLEAASLHINRVDQQHGGSEAQKLSVMWLWGVPHGKFARHHTLRQPQCAGLRRRRPHTSHTPTTHITDHTRQPHWRHINIFVDKGDSHAHRTRQQSHHITYIP